MSYRSFYVCVLTSVDDSCLTRGHVGPSPIVPLFFSHFFDSFDCFGYLHYFLHVCCFLCFFKGVLMPENTFLTNLVSF